LALEDIQARAAFSSDPLLLNARHFHISWPSLRSNVTMQPLFAEIFLQSGMSAKQPGYFVPVLLGLLIAGGIGWLIAAVLGFARARAFGASTRWFSFAALCLLLYHIQFVLLGMVAVMGAQQNDFDSVLGFGAFFNVFVVLGAFCAVMGFVRLTNPR